MRFDPAIFTAPRTETTKQVRMAGAVLLILGPVLLAGGAIIAWLLLGIAVPSSWLPEGTRVEGTPGEGLSQIQRAGLWGLAVLLLACGGATVLQGSWQLLLGRKNKWLLRFIVVSAVGFAVAGVVASIYTGCPIGRICQ